MSHSSIATLSCALASWLLIAIPAPTARAADAIAEIGAGGLSFAPNPSIRVEQQDVLVTPDKIAVTYTIRNEATSEQAIYLTFLLPDLDANAVTEGEVAVPGADPTNFVKFSTLVDGQPVAPRVEQRAMALGLDVTALLSASGLPLFPFADGLATRLEQLTLAQRSELLERGILKEEGSAVAPAWTLKTIAYWRQPFNAEQSITVQHTYRPIAGVASYRAEAMPALRKRACVSAAQEAAIAKLPSVGGIAPTLTSVIYSATANADALGPVRRFRLIVETGDALTIVASCRDGLKQTGPMQLDWSATDYTPDEDFQLLFAR